MLRLPVEVFRELIPRSRQENPPRGMSRLAVDANTHVTGLVEAMHASMARMPARDRRAAMSVALGGMIPLLQDG